MGCKWQIENSTLRIVPKILYSPNRTNRSNRQASSQVPEYCDIFLSVANEMQMADRKLYLADRPKRFSIRQIDKRPPGSQNIMKYFLVSPMGCKWQIENSTWRIVPKILYSPNRTNRSNRQASSRVPEYCEIFLSVAYEMQMAYRKLYLADHPKNSLFAKKNSCSYTPATQLPQEYNACWPVQPLR